MVHQNKVYIKTKHIPYLLSDSVLHALIKIKQMFFLKLFPTFWKQINHILQLQETQIRDNHGKNKIILFQS